MMQVVGCDIDGVLADIKEPLERRVAEYFKVPISEVANDKFYMEERFGIPAIDMQAFLGSELCFDDPEFWLEAKPIQKNIDALWSLVDYSCDWDHEIILATGRHNKNRAVTNEWLDKYNVPRNTLLMQCLDLKHKALKFAGATLMFEDRFREAMTIAESGIKSYVVERTYNIEHKQLHAHENLHWCIDLEEAFIREQLIV